jgi:hypothetical protein
MKTNGPKPTYSDMVDRWGDSHFFTELEGSDWDQETLCLTREMVCVLKGVDANMESQIGKYSCKSTIKAKMYLDRDYYNQWRSTIENDELHATYPMYYVNNGKSMREHMFNSWDLLEEDIQGQTAPLLPFHPPEFDYGGVQDNFTSTGVLIPIDRTEFFVNGEFIGVDYREYSNQSETEAGMKQWEWDETLPFKLYKNYDDARLYLAPTRPLNWLRNGVTFLNR